MSRRTTITAALLGAVATLAVIIAGLRAWFAPWKPLYLDDEEAS